MMKKYLITGVFLTSLFAGCSSKKEKKTETAIPKKIGRVITDSVAPPVVTLLTGAQAPRVIKAAKPVIVPLTYPYGVGVPSFTNYSVKDGLSSNYVTSAVTDREGNTWFATMSGLSKFDGTRFTNYNTGNGLISDFTKNLLIDSRNRIWIGTFYGLSIFDGKSFSNPLVDNNYPKDQIGITNMVEDKKGAIWLSSFHGLYRYEQDKFTKFNMADGLADSITMDLLLDKNGDLLIMSFKGITRFDGKVFSPYTHLPNGKDGRTPRLLYTDSKGNIWFYNYPDELGKFDGQHITTYSKKDGYNGGSAFLEDKDGNYWIGGLSSGLARFDGNRFINYTEKNGLASNRILSLAEDEQGNIWAMSQDKGLSKLNNTYLSDVEIPEGGGVDQIIVDRSGTKWTTGTKGLGKYNRDHIAYYGREVIPPGSSIYNPFADHAGNIWFFSSGSKNSENNLVKFDGTTFTCFGKDQGLSMRNLNDISEDRFHNIWLAGQSGGKQSVGVIKADGSSFSGYGRAQGLQTSFGIFSVFQDKKNCYWFGSDSAGVYKYDGKQFTVYGTRDGLPHNFVNDITEDSLGNIWLATDGGAAKFDGNSFTAYRSGNGLGNIIPKVEYDTTSKSVWFTTYNGLASVKMEQLQEEKPFFQHYNPRTGFPFASSMIDRVFIDKDGVVWGGGFNNVFRFEYNATRNFKPLPVRVKNIRLDNKNISWNCLRNGAYPEGSQDSLAAVNEMVLKFNKVFSPEDLNAEATAFGKVRYDSVAGPDFIPVNLVLPITHNNISFEFGTISTSFGIAVQYQFKLEGYDKHWSELSPKTEASFGNMREGNYTFRVRALSPFGSWSEASYSFTVLPPWWRTWWAYTIYALLFISGVFLFIRWRTKALQKEKIQLEEKVTIRTAELNQSLDNLKATQSQLIQSEKMASLGELTAGIAHEIQNPLNFINNFSEVNSELIEEMNDELNKGEVGEAKIIAGDIKQNLEKIHHHGKRADAIVKGMLQHSRSSNGIKEPTDINALADEYLRLAYHGLRARDKSFNATMKTDFDTTIGKINMISQDIGRVLLNLINNAFYASSAVASNSVKNSSDKLASEGAAPLPSERGFTDPAYKHVPTVWVSTKKAGDKVLISVKDNGPGIPKNILDKIFQPFFTTKPTGQGTGLGLSLSYDIVKAHGGELKVETGEGEGTLFTVLLPI